MLYFGWFWVNWAVLFKVYHLRSKAYTINWVCQNIQSVFTLLGIYNFGHHSHSNSLARNGTRCITLGRLHFSCWCMCSMFVFKRFFFFGENLQGSKKIHSGLLRFPSSLPCTQGGPTFYMQKLHSNLKHLIPIHTFKKIFFKSVNICCSIQNNTSHFGIFLVGS